MSTSNIFSNVYIYGNCTVKGTLTTLGGSAVSQWTTAGSIIYYNTGNIGIGTATPGQLLSLNNGNILLAGTWTAGTTYSLIGYNTDKRLEFNYSNGTVIYDNNAFLVRTGGSSGGIGNLGLYQNATGYVGIGTTNPGSLLTVSGGVGIGSGYNAFTAPTGGLIVQGNVGIGTSNPGVNALQVTGNVVTSGFTSNATNTVFNFDTLTVPFVSATQIGIGTAAPNCSLDIRGVVGITNTVPYAVPNNFMRAGTLTIGDGSLNYGGGSSWNSNTAGFMMECLNTTECAIHDSGDRLVSFMYYSGNKIGIGRDMGWGVIAGVGIGTTNPTVKLDIVGALKTSTNSTNYIVGTGSAITVNTTTPTTVATVSITTVGKPVFVMCSGDLQPVSGVNDWVNMRVYRDATPIGNATLYHPGTAGSTNHMFSIHAVDVPSAGTYTYTVKAWLGAGSIQFGEVGVPYITAWEFI